MSGERNDEAGFLADNLARFLLGQRMQSGLSQAGLAKKAGVSQSVIARIETGKVGVNSIPFASLPPALGLGQEALLWAMIDRTYMHKLRNVDILPILRAIVHSEVKSLSVSDLMDLLRIESGLQEQDLCLTTEMVVSLLAQTRRKR